MTLAKHPKTLLVIVAEAVLESRLVDDARAQGAQGWWVTEVHGAGREGVRDGDWEADRTVEIKIIGDDAVVDRIAEHVLALYAPHYQVALHFTAVTVLRPDRY